MLRWGPRNNRIECTKFNEGCTKFCEECTKGSKVHSEVEINPNHILMGSKMKSWTIHIQMGDSEVIGSNVPNLIKHVPNFANDVPNFVKDVLRVPNCIPRWGSAPNHFLMGSKMKSRTIHVQMGVPEVIGSDVLNLMKDVPNFVKDVPSFVNDVPRVLKCVSR